jgi:two-component system response regulator HydG
MAAILVTDDEKTCRESIQKVLEKEGHEVEGAESVDKALEILAARKFDLIVCDYRMPGKSGIDFLEELARRGAEVPVIMISAFADKSTERAAIAMGAAELLRKPLRRRELIESAMKAIGG